MTDEKSKKDPKEKASSSKEPAKEQKSEAGSPSFAEATEGRQKTHLRQDYGGQAEAGRQKTEEKKSSSAKATADNKKKKSTEKKPPLTQKEIDKLIIENADLQANTKEVQDNFLLLAAEFENYKKRINKDQQRSKELYKDSMLANLLPVIDDIDRALQHHDKDSEISEGFSMIRSKLLSYLENYKVSPFKVVGEEFDPEKHDAMLTRALEDEKDNIILEEFEKGYMIDKKVLRHAKVIVNIIE
ncbi:MAG: nucleotide exchange factor GrpE [Candidatus Marinimicrobia bacterium]|nr:nucleotide exchange factor GrpE [Candidatus Neomarinimicrobiota bacterium]